MILTAESEQLLRFVLKQLPLAEKAMEASEYEAQNFAYQFMTEARELVKGMSA